MLEFIAPVTSFPSINLNHPTPIKRNTKEKVDPHALRRAPMHGPIARALALVVHGLGIALGAVGLDPAGDAIGRVGDALLQLRGCALGRVRGDLFFGA